MSTLTRSDIVLHEYKNIQPIMSPTRAGLIFFILCFLARSDAMPSRRGVPAFLYNYPERADIFDQNDLAVINAMFSGHPKRMEEVPVMGPPNWMRYG
ncbi:unnamed protein product [Fasciola hepatica]|uniref:Uncharacterized protein n=1 Tax=Fasciola hepatica TaxID=6192 RepID=A0ABC9HFF2_FASHE